MRISEYDRVLSPSEGDLFVIETLEGTKTIAYEDMGFVSKSSTETIGGTKTFSGTVNLDNPLAIKSGGTGATSVAAAKENLGLGTSAQNFRVVNPFASSQALHFDWVDKNANSVYNGKRLLLIISDASISLYNVNDSKSIWSHGYPIGTSQGGTGATTAALARKNLGLGNTTGALPIANGGTGATTAALARTALGIGAAGTLGTPIPVNRGGTAGTTAALARTNLGIGAAGTLGTPIPLNRGGTGATTAAAALSNLGIGSKVHNYGASWTTSYSKTISEATTNAILFFGSIAVFGSIHINSSSGWCNFKAHDKYETVGTEIGGSSTVYHNVPLRLEVSISGNVATLKVYQNFGYDSSYYYATLNLVTGAITMKGSAGGSNLYQLITFS